MVDKNSCLFLLSRALEEMGPSFFAVRRRRIFVRHGRIFVRRRRTRKNDVDDYLQERPESVDEYDVAENLSQGDGDEGDDRICAHQT